MSFKTWEDTIGYVFGSGIQAFEEGHFPTNFDVSRRLIYLIDEERKTRLFSPVVAISKVTKELVDFWEIHSSLPIKSTEAIGMYKNCCSKIKKTIYRGPVFSSFIENNLFFLCRKKSHTKFPSTS